MSPRVPVVVGWSLWTLLLVGLLFVGLRVLTERTSSPEAGRGLGLALVILLVAGLLALGGGFYWALRAHSLVAQWVLIAVMAYPLVVLIAGPIVKSTKDWQAQREIGRSGDFREPHARAMAEAIARNDAAALRELLAAGPVPTERDRAGNSLLAWAVVAMCDGSGGIDPLEVLLGAGVSAQGAADGEGRPLILRLLLSHYRVPRYADAIALLLDHGAEPDQVDAITGRTTLQHAGEHPEIVRMLAERGADVERLDEYGCPPVVAFVGTRCWASTLYLVDRGVRLDVVSPSGVSFEYYFTEWANGVYGAPPPELVVLRAAVERRRPTQPRP